MNTFLPIKKDAISKVANRVLEIASFDPFTRSLSLDHPEQVRQTIAPLIAKADPLTTMSEKDLELIARNIFEIFKNSLIDAQKHLDWRNSNRGSVDEANVMFNLCGVNPVKKKTMTPMPYGLSRGFY